MLFSSKGNRRVSKTTARVIAGVGLVGAGIAAPLMATTSASAASVATWDKVAQCESSGNWSNSDTGGNGHFGGLQFSPSSWAAAGGTKFAPRADLATKGQQISVAEKLLAMQGPGAWQCAGAGGLTAGGPAADVSAAGAAAKTAKPAATTQAHATAKPQAVKVVAKPRAAEQAAPRAKAAVQQPTVRGAHSVPVQKAAPVQKAVPVQKSAPVQKAAPAKKAAPVNTITTQSAPQAKATGGYRVVSGDTLAGIAAAHGVDWHKLYDLNKGTIGGNPNLILPGQQLVLS
jgi:resuscitation-promoting factor RpfA